MFVKRGYKMNQHIKNIKILSDKRDKEFYIYSNLSVDSKKDERQKLIFEITGIKTPKHKCGVHKIIELFA